MQDKGVLFAIFTLKSWFSTIVVLRTHKNAQLSQQ